MTLLIARPLTAEAYAPYGDVVMAAPHGEAGAPANQGTARRFDHLARLVNLRAGADLNVSVFRCAPRRDFPAEITLLERHPSSTQLFVPMTARRYLVVVAQGSDAPDLATLGAFVAEAGQAVSYKPGVWHHPMIALDDTCDFACFVYEDGTQGDCDVHELDASMRPRIALA